MDNYKTIATKLANREPFKGNTLTATAEITDLGRVFTYKVYSYSTLIALKTWDGMEGEWFTWVNPNKYSVTTSRQQNLIKRAWGVN